MMTGWIYSRCAGWHLDNWDIFHHFCHQLFPFECNWCDDHTDVIHLSQFFSKMLVLPALGCLCPLKKFLVRYVLIYQNNLVIDEVVHHNIYACSQQNFIWSRLWWWCPNEVTPDCWIPPILICILLYSLVYPVIMSCHHQMRTSNNFLVPSQNK